MAAAWGNLDVCPTYLINPKVLMGKERIGSSTRVACRVATSGYKPGAKKLEYLL